MENTSKGAIFGYAESSPVLGKHRSLFMRVGQKYINKKKCCYLKKSRIFVFLHCRKIPKSRIPENPGIGISKTPNPGILENQFRMASLKYICINTHLL